MAFVEATGQWHNVRIPAKASITYTAGMLVANDATNDVPVTAQTQQYIRGIVVEAKSNAATTTSIAIRVPNSPNCTFYAGVVSTESITATDVGKSYDLEATGLLVSTNTTYRPVQLVRYISANKGEFKFNYTTGIEN